MIRVNESDDELRICSPHRRSGARLLRRKSGFVEVLGNRGAHEPGVLSDAQERFGEPALSQAEPVWRRFSVQRCSAALRSAATVAR